MLPAWPVAALTVALCLAPGVLVAQSYTQLATPYNFIATAGHTVLNGFAAGLGCPDTNGDDSISAPINIGFTYRFGATSYTQVRIFTNGRLEFGSTYCYFGTSAVGPPRTYPDPMAAANVVNTMRVYGADLDVSPAGGGTITYSTVGAAPNRRFVVTWNNVLQWSAAGTSYNLQIQLDEGGDFYYMYGTNKNTANSGEVLGPAQIGWELTTTDFVVVQSGLPANNTGMRFRLRPVLNVAKTSAVISDPIDGTTNPKRIPGAIIRYSVTLTNTGVGTVDTGTAITDPVPAGTDLYVGSVSGQAVDFIDGATPSGLSFAFPANVSYSNTPGGTSNFTYTPIADAAGFDPAVTGVRIAPTGVMNAAVGAASPSFTVRFRTRIR